MSKANLLMSHFPRNVLLFGMLLSLETTLICANTVVPEEVQTEPGKSVF